MSVVVAFYIVAILCAVTLIGVWLLRKLRYVIWKDYFRAEFVCEDGDVVTRTFRLKGTDTEFTCKVKGVTDTYHIISNSDDDRVYRTGRFRLPKAYYIAHRAEPLNLIEMKMESAVSATRYRELAKNTVTSQLLNAFTENPMKEALALFLAIGIILGGMLLLGYFLNSKIDAVAQMVGG